MRSLRRRTLPLLWLAATLAAGVGASRPARAQDLPTTADRVSDEADLARPIDLYESGDYEQCAKTLADLLDPKSSRALQHPEVVERARVYYAACLIGSGRGGDAEAPLREAIRQNTQMAEPDSLIFPRPVIEAFLRVRQSLRKEIDAAEQETIARARDAARAKEQEQAEERARLAELERLATEQTVVVRNRRAIALIPFGVGQFQNGSDALGWVFLTSEVVLSGLVLTSWAIQGHLIKEREEAKAAGRNVDDEEVSQRLQDWQTLLEVSSWSFLAIAAGGIVEAQLSFVPEFRSTRRRPLPKKQERPAPRTSITVTPETGGARLGIVGRF